MQLSPEHVPPLKECLSAVQSHEAQTRKAAEATLENLSKCVGFCSCLLEIVADRSTDRSIRWMASSNFKNTAERLWRPRQNAQCLTPEEKAHIRARLLDLLREDDSQIAVQLCVAMGRVARVDYPKEWPHLIESLLGIMDKAAADMLLTRRVFLALHHVLKELSSRRLRADQASFQALTERVLPLLFNRWCQETQALLGVLPSALGNAAEAQQVKFLAERWLLLLKVVHRLVVMGIPSDGSSLTDHPLTHQVLRAVFDALRAVLAVRTPGAGVGAGGAAAQQLGALVDRGLRKMAKSLRDAMRQHPYTYRLGGLLRECLEFFGGQIVSGPTAEGSQAASEFKLQCMLFVYEVLQNQSYKRTAGSEPLMGAAAGLYTPAEGNEARQTRVKQLEAEVWGAGGGGLEAFYRPDSLGALLVAIIERYLPLTASELRDAEDDPEVFHADSDGVNLEERLRPCAEALSLAIIDQDREALCPHVASMLTRVLEGCPPGTAGRQGLPCVRDVPQAVLVKEAVYNIVGLAAYQMHDYVDLDSWLASALLPECSDPTPQGTILRRRAAIVIGQWVMKMTEDSRPRAYEALVSLLRTDNPLLQLAALAALRNLIDDWGFYEDGFAPYIGATLECALNLLPNASQLDTQIQVFSFVSLITERMAESIRPFAPALLASVPGVWQLGEGQPLVQMQILRMLAKLVNALGPESAISHHLIAPLLESVTRTDHPAALTLQEEALILWLVALRNAPQPELALLSPFPNLVEILTSSTEKVQVGMQIITSCVLLAGPTFLQLHGASVVSIITALMGQLNERGMCVLLPVVELLVQCYPNEAPQALDSALVRLFQLILEGKETSLTLAAAFRVVSRLVLQSPAYWPGYLVRCGANYAGWPAPYQQASGPAEAALLALLDIWLSRFDTLATSSVRRMNGLALSSVLAMPLGGVVGRVPQVLTLVTKLWSEELPEESYLYAFRSLDHEGEDDTVVQSADAEGEYGRRTALGESDPVAHSPLGPHIKAQLYATASVHGPRVWEAVQSLPSEVQDTLKRAMEETKPGM